jgi:hypothetical protein
LGKVGIDTPVALLVGVGERAAHDSGADAYVIELALMCPQTGFDIPKALPIGQLCERHAEILVETPKPFYIPLALVALHATPECVHWQVVGHLGENELARIHA